MTKPFTLLLIAFIVIVSGCSKSNDEPNYNINSETVQLKYDEDFQFQIAGDPAYVAWTSSDESIGTVDEKGLFSAHRIGTTTVTAWIGSISVSSEVTVDPYHDFFQEPLSDFSLTGDQIKSKETRSIVTETDEGIMYAGENASIRRVMYTLKSGKLASAYALFGPPETMIEKVVTYYAERYLFFGNDEEFLLFKNGAGAVIGISVNPTLGLNAAYLSENVVSASIIGNIRNDVTLSEAVRGFLNSQR